MIYLIAFESYNNRVVTVAENLLKLHLLELEVEANPELKRVVLVIFKAEAVVN